MSISFFVGLLIRIAVSFLASSVKNYDTQSWLTVGSEVLKNHSIYPGVASLHHPYFPFYLYLTAAAVFLQQYFGLSYILIIRLVLSLFDSLIIILVYKLAHDRKISAWLYALNPITILVTSVQAQFDATVVFFLLLSVYFLINKKSVVAYLAFSVALILKAWPLFFFFPLLRRTKRISNPTVAITCLIALVSIPVLSLIFYSIIWKTDPLVIIKTVLSYRPVFGVFGSGIIIKSLFSRTDMVFVNQITKIFVVALIIFSLAIRKRSAIEEILTLMLFFLFFTPDFGIQWLAWVVPFLVLTTFSGFVLYSLSAAALLLVTTLSWSGGSMEIFIFPALTMTWLTIGALLIKQVLGSKNIRPEEHVPVR